MPEDALARYVEQRTGMKFTGVQRQRLMRVLERASAGAGLTRPAYLNRLREQPSSFDALVDDLTVRETYFFRERGQLEWLRMTLATRAGRRSRSRVHVWSAGCASGEEAFTSAMLLDDVAGSVDVLGTDISRVALDQAEAARYGVRALRGVSDVERNRYFRKDGESFVVRDSFRRAARFERRNVLDGPPAHGVFDVVLCRNVLIYFTGGAIATVAEGLRGALALGGWLVTGSSDPVLDVEGLVRVATPHGLMYQRVTAPVTVLGPALPSTRQPRVGKADRPLSAALPAVQPVVGAPAPDAVAAAQAAVEALPVDAGRRYALAVLQLERGDLRAAADAAGAAVFLDPSRVAAHLLLARVHQAMGRHDRAQQSFRAAATLLERLPPGADVDAGEGETVQSLADVTAAALAGYARRGNR